jgi:hypothetical protein
MAYPRYGLTPSPPSKSLTATVYDFGDINFIEIGPKGGFSSMTVPKESLATLARLIDGALDWPERCYGCGRESSECSSDPCEDVIADREEEVA